MPMALLLLWMFPQFLQAEEKKGEIPVTTSSDAAYQAFTEGREAYEMGRIGDARVLVDKALKADPGFALGYLYKAYLAGSAEDWKSALELAIRHSSKVSEGEKLLVGIEEAWQAGDPGKRFELAKTLVDRYPGDVRAHLMLAGEYQLRKQVNLYRDRVNQAILADPRSPLGYRALAVSWLFNLPLDFDLAEKYMVEYASLRPGEAIALLSVGDVCRAKMQFLKAYTAYTTALQLDPLSGVGLSKRGYMNTYLGQLNEARSDFEKANSLTGGGSQIEAPNNNLVCFFFCGNVKRAAEELQKMHSPASVSVPSKNKGVQRVADHHRFCCSMIAQTHGIYTATNASDDECCCLQKDFTRESYPPDKETIDALFAFVESMRALDSKNYELAAQKAEEYALILQPGVRPEKSQVYQYLMGVISFRQDHYHSAVSHFLKSDLTNNCVKFDLALAYDKLGEFEKAGEMMKDVSGCVFTSSYTPEYVERSQRYMKKVAMLPEE